MNSTLKVFGVLIVFFTLALIGLIMGFNTQAQTVELSDDEQAQVEFIKTLDSRLLYSESKTLLIKDKNLLPIGTEDIVDYSYLGNEIDSANIIFKDNNQYSNTEKINNNTFKIYEQPAFYKNTNGQVQEIITERVGQTIWNTTKIPTTIEKIQALLHTPYALADSYYSENDGQIQANTSSWAGCLSATTGSKYAGMDAFASYVSASNFYLARGFLEFDISAIDMTGYDISTSSIWLIPYGAHAPTNRAYKFFGGTQSDPLVGDDFNNFTTDEMSSEVTDPNLTLDVYNEFALTNTGTTSLIDGVNKFVLRVNNDYNNSAPGSGDADWTPALHFYDSSESGTTKDPYLIVNLVANEEEAETPTATTTDDLYPCAIPDNGRIDIITGCKNIYNGTTSSSTITGVEFFYYEIPMAIWLVFGTCFIYLFSRLRLEYLMRFRK